MKDKTKRQNQTTGRRDTVDVVVMLNCPFCGSKAEIMAGYSEGSSHKMQFINNGAQAIISDWKFWKSKTVWCPKCIIMRHGEGKTEKVALRKAIEKWNMRDACL